MFKLMSKKIITIFHSKMSLTGPMNHMCNNYHTYSTLYLPVTTFYHLLRQNKNVFSKNVSNGRKKKMLRERMSVPTSIQTVLLSGRGLERIFLKS